MTDNRRQIQRTEEGGQGSGFGCKVSDDRKQKTDGRKLNSGVGTVVVLEGRDLAAVRDAEVGTRDLVIRYWLLLSDANEWNVHWFNSSKPIPKLSFFDNFNQKK